MPKDFVYKTVSTLLNKEIEEKNNKENRRRKITGKITLKQGENCILEVTDKDSNIKVSCTSKNKIKLAENMGIFEERIKEQISKTGNTIFEVESLDVNLENKVIMPISELNELRREALGKLEEEIVKSFVREEKNISIPKINNEEKIHKKTEVTLSINRFKKDINYENIKNIDNIYIRVEAFLQKENEEILNNLCKNKNVYVMLPAITKGIFLDLIKEKIKTINVKGVVLSNISQMDLAGNKEKIANYTFNAFNNLSINELKKLGFSKIILSPELNKNEIENLTNILPKEYMVYGRALLMISEYCAIGTYKNCKGYCKKGKYILKDRLGFKFPIYTNQINCNNYIYNSKITSVKWQDLNVDSIKIDILDEDEKEIQNIIDKHITNERLEGEDYTNGNLNKEI